jgi:7-cyano-7-deazaguanine synthase
MCSIFGAFGSDIDLKVLQSIRVNAGDRGRDGGQMEMYLTFDDRKCFLGNWRATPTTEVQSGRLQPYDGIVHNGTIANDKDIGGLPGEIDSEVLPRVIDRTDVYTVATSLAKIKGSYALAIVNDKTCFLAANYKPIYYYIKGGTVYFSSMARHFKSIVLRGTAPVKVEPYSVLDLRTFESCPLKRIYNNRAIVIASGGLDSTVVASYLKSRGMEITLVHYRYGCVAEMNEATRIPQIAQALGCDFRIFDLPYTDMAGDSPLLDCKRYIEGAIPGAEFAYEWVPARNLVMLAHATAFAEANDYHTIALGNNLEEAGAYPDNEEEFTGLFNELLSNAVRDGFKLNLVSPVGNLMKHEIVALGHKLNTPFGLTWSCYRDGEISCGECGPDFMRRTAFERNGLSDPLEYKAPLKRTKEQNEKATT